MMYSCFKLASTFLILHASCICITTASASGPHGSPVEDPVILAPITRRDLLAMYSQQLQTKSEQMCDKYAKEVENNTGISCFDIVPILRKIGCDPAAKDIETEVDKFPHMVALGKHNSDETFTLICGGALVSHTWILSAAHCSQGSNGNLSHARIGVDDSRNENSGVIIGIKKIIPHPAYKPSKMYADIALVELVSAVTFSVSIRPACLFQDDVQLATAWNSGWNAWNAAGEQSDLLLKAELDLINNSECTNVYNNVRELPDGIRQNMLCANDSHRQWDRGTCLGQSGSPLQTRDPIYNCLYQVIGITSLGLNCAIINTPGVYTKVSYYIPWIENMIW